MTVDEFLASRCDLSALGFFKCDEAGEYFCDPVGARVIGRCGVDGVHFCTVDGLGEYVFVVDPTGGAVGGGGYVRAAARTFSEFLGLLLACRDTAAISQADGWDRAEFESFVSEIGSTAETEAALARIRSLGVGEIGDAYGYMKEVAGEVGADRLVYGVEYYELTSPVEPVKRWNVSFGGAFFDVDGDDACAVGVTVKRGGFEWGGEEWHVLGVYKVMEGFVVDLGRRLTDGQVDALQELEREAEAEIPVEEREVENPLSFSFTARLAAGGVRVSAKRVTAVVGSPVFGDDDGESVREHYGCGEGSWQFYRCSFPWLRERGEPEEIVLSAKQTRVCVGELRSPVPGDTLSVRDPAGGGDFTLTVCAVEDSELTLPNGGAFEVPGCVTYLRYTFEPEAGASVFSVRDAEAGDPPRVRGGAADFVDSAIGIIGGADGPTAVFVGAGSAAKGGAGGERVVLSNPRFALSPVRWRVDAAVRDRADISVVI